MTGTVNLTPVTGIAAYAVQAGQKILTSTSAGGVGL